MKLYFKAVTLDKKSWYDKKTLWEPGAIIKPDMVDENNNSCGHGIHCSPTILGAVEYQNGPSLYCLVKPGRIIAADDTKARCESVECVRFLIPAETDKASGFKLWEANHPVNPLFLKTKIKSKKWLLDNLKDWDSVGASVGDSVWDSVWASIRAYIGGLFPDIKEWKYIPHNPDPWRPLLNLWYAGYVPSFDGKKWRLHAGEKAEVVFEWKGGRDDT